MTHIEQMIKDMCPNGVEWKTLGEVCGVQRGKRLTKSELSDSEKYPVYHGGIEPLGFYKEYNREAETVMVINVGASAGTIGYSKEPFWSSDGCFCLRHSDTVIARFIYYYLQTREKEIKSRVRYAGIPTLDGFVVEQFPIPLPPLEIQEKIVECLDKFSALAAELQAELQLRRKQYEYYRTQLLTPPSDCNSADNTDDCNWENVKFSDVASYIRGVTYNKHDELHEQSESAIKVLRANNITLKSNSLNLDEVKFIRSDVRVKQEQYLRKNDIFICAGSGSKEHVGKVAFINEDMDYTFGGFMGVVRTREKVTSKFLYYILTSSIFKEYLIGALNSTTINNLNNTIMSEFCFIIPPLAEQARIVSILDKFEALTTSLSDGIPAEQAAQQKRYEYYRDLLLTFPRK